MNRARPVQRWLANASLADRFAALLLVVLVGMVVLVGPTPTDGRQRSIDWLVIPFLVAAGALLALARRFPVTIALALVALSVGWYGVGYTNRLIDVPTLVAFYVVGRTGDRWRQVLVLGPTMAALLLSAIGDADRLRVGLTGVGLATAAILSGELVRSRQLLLDQLADRATRAERDRDLEAERRVADERLRIARDVHDVLAHTVSVMTVQAGVAADAVNRDPSATAAALQIIRTAGKQAMGEIRSTVAVLRGADPAATAPAPGLDRLPELAEAIRAHGVEVDVSTDVGSAGIDPLTELTAYRVIQESLTNVGRHAHASRVRVEVVRTQDALVIDVADDGVTAWREPGPSGGFGLRGMGERVAAVGGRIGYGPVDGGGWAVHAELPLERDR